MSQDAGRQRADPVRNSPAGAAKSVRRLPARVQEPATTDCTAQDLTLAVGVNLAGCFWLTQPAIGQMLKRHSGHVVNISASIAEQADSVEPTALTALTKGGLAAVARSPAAAG